MNKNAIWGIIGLMSIALIGIIALQAYWINERLRLEETYFDNTVFSILNKVSEKLEDEEEKRTTQMIWNAENLTTTLKNGGSNAYNLDMGVGFGFFNRSHKFDTLGYGVNHTNTLECNCIVCKKEKFEAREWRNDQWMLKQLINPDPIEERVRVEHLDDYFKQELLNMNVDLDYTYGIYSHTKKAFVIRDGKYNYVPLDEGDFGSQAVSFPNIDKVPNDNGDLLNSKYSVQLFHHSSTLEAPPGYLMIHFPGKVGYVWRTVLSTVLAAILFTGIILFCFIYTIQVIFTQKKLSKIKSDFINNMTHEFKTPIATISLASDSITNPMVSGNPSKVQRFANIIKQENKRMNNQVEKVLQMALLDKNDFQLKITQVDAHEVIRQAVNNINLRAERKGGKAEAILKASNSFVEADLTHFSNVVNNLLDNAYKYSNDNPEITITTENKSNGINIRIKDNGIGMSKDDLKHIFDKFFRVHTGNLHDVKGFGLGLSYVKAIMNAHKGQISVKSDLGKGSEFTLFFPYVNG